MKKFSSAIAICGLLFAANLATAGHGDGTLLITYPVGGGPITLTASGGDVPAAGLDFTSASGNLIPTGGTDASPFTFFLSNTPNQITYANLGSAVLFADGTSTVMSAGYSGGPDCDLTFLWGDSDPPVAFPACPFDLDGPVTASPVRGSTLDFGLVARNDVFAFRLTDAIKIIRSFPETFTVLTHFEITGASVFDVPDFAPVIFSDGQPDVEFDLVLDVGAPPGHYEAELSIFGDFSPPNPITYSLTAQIVPEPSSMALSAIGVLAVTIFVRIGRKKATPA